MNAPDDAESRFLIVGLGGSAGSIASFREFFRHVRPDSGMAYVVILHLAPEQESRLAEVLQTAAQIPVMQVRESIRVEPNHVYVIPPNRSLSMQDGTAVLSNVTTFEERHAPIDIFFRTLAETHDSRAVCAVMSGTGSDGSMGLRRIKEYNGLVLVQDPSEAAFGEMPRSAIATGLVDFVVPVAEMASRIRDYRDQLQNIHIADDEGAERAAGDEQALTEIFTLLRLRTGHDFTNYKRTTVLRRLERRMALRDRQQLPQYAALLREQNEEAHALLRELLISVTNFFRDMEVWQKLEKTTIPALLANRRPEGHLRIWVAGCATGEEAYSIAMLLAEHDATNVQIFATDLDEQGIAKARSGWYSDSDVADVSPERLRRFFRKEEEGYRVRREVRETVLFAHHDVIRDPPFARLDFVSCRNLLIYLNRTAQQRVLEVLHFALEPGGLLLLGTAEAVDEQANLFSLVDKEMHLYQSRAGERVIKLGGAGPATTGAFEVRQFTPQLPAPARIESRLRERLVPLDLHHRLLEQYAAPSVVVDEQYDIMHLSERAGQYLQFSAGEASMNLMQAVRQELRGDLRSALFQAGQRRVTVAARAVAVHTASDRGKTIDLVVRPVLSDDDPPRGYFLVLFEQGREREEPVRETAAVDAVSRQLEEELIRVKAQMRASIEQYELQAEEATAANEELQAMNEELRSTAEELETSQEELQSVNEELQTVNQELKVKIEEITHAGDDLRNLISSTDIGTVFVDRSFQVKLFTPGARQVFNLIPADVGRPLTDITNKLRLEGFMEEMAHVLERLQTVEREVQTRDGAWYLMRLLPYRTLEDRIDGVVLTFLDVTERHKAQEKLRESEARLAADLAGMRRLYQLHAKLATETELQSAMDEILAAATEFAGTDRGCVQLLSDDDRVGLEAVAYRGYTEDSPFIRQFRYQGFSEGGDAARVERRRMIVEDTAASPCLEGTADGAAARAEGIRAVHSTPIVTRRGETIGVLSVQYREPHRPEELELRLLDLLAWTAGSFIERHRAELALRENEARLQKALSIETVGVLFFTFDGRVLDANAAFERMSGYARETLRSEAGKPSFAPVLLGITARSAEQLSARGETGPYEKEMVRPDGSRWWGLVSPRSLTDGDSDSECVAFVIDITETKRAEEATAAELEATRTIRDLGTRLVSETAIARAYQDILAAAVRLTHADAGSLQMLDPATNELLFLATEGLDQSIVRRFARIDVGANTSCGISLASGERIVIDYDDPAADEDGSLRAIAEAGFRSGQSTPLITRAGQPTGMLSTHWREHRRPTDAELRHLDLIARQAADLIERRVAEAALRESEARLHAIANLVPDLLWMTEPGGERNWVNERWLAYTGQTEEEALGWGWMAAIHPDDRAHAAESYARAVAEGQPLQQERRIGTAAGDYRWFLVNAVPVLSSDGRVVRYYGAATDVHEQRMAREQLEERVRERTQALLDLSVNRQQLLDRLVTATEEERQRIALELHDEMGQHITALRMGLESLQPRNDRIDELKDIITRIDRSIDRLTLELRPPALDQLGLHGAITSLADAFSAASGIRVALHVTVKDGDRFPVEVETALYRVLQESLTNVWKHASAATVSVIFERERDTLRLIIEDNGSGFDTAGAGDGARRGHFGLLGMRERLALVGGTLDVESQPGGGTTVYARVPLPPAEIRP